MVTEARGPWPGSFYSVPLALVVAAGLAMAAFALHRVPRCARQGEDTATDDTLRAQAAGAVTAAVGPAGAQRGSSRRPAALLGGRSGRDR